MGNTPEKMCEKAQNNIDQEQCDLLPSVQMESPDPPRLTPNDKPKYIMSDINLLQKHRPNEGHHSSENFLCE